MEGVRKELSRLLNSHEILECDDSDCVICIRVKEIGQLLSVNTPKYKLTNRDGRVIRFKSSREVQHFLRTGHERVMNAIRTGRELKCWKIEKAKGE